MTVYDPDNEEFDKVMLVSSRSEEDIRENLPKDHQHKSYHKKAQKPGWYRICLKAHKSLFHDNPNLKYEMSIQIDSLFESQFETREEQQEMEEQKASLTQFKNLITREHYDKVDLMVDSLESRAEAIILDQAY